MKIDPYKHKERYLNWKEKIKGEIPEVGKFNSDLILKYLDNMEHGLNIASTNKKGCRSYIRLNTLREDDKLISQIVDSYRTIEVMNLNQKDFDDKTISQKIKKGNKDVICF